MKPTRPHLDDDSGECVTGALDDYDGGADMRIVWAADLSMTGARSLLLVLDGDACWCLCCCLLKNQ